MKVGGVPMFVRFYVSDFFMDSLSISKKGWFLKFNIIDIDIDIDRYWNSIRMVLSPEISCSVFHPFQKTIRRERRLATRSPRLVTLQRSWERSAVFSGKSWEREGFLNKKPEKERQSPMNIWFIGGLEPWNLRIMTFHSVGNGMSSSQLTKSIIFQDG